MTNRRLPDFIIIGAQKSASTFVQDVLSAHPDIHMPGTETRFFEDPEYGDGDVGKLAELFDGRREKMLGIKRPDYLGRDEVPARIQKNIPHAKIIIVLRNPIDRLISAYYYYIKLGFIPVADINKAIPSLLAGSSIGSIKSGELLSYGRYSTHLARYRRLFPDKQIHILFQEDIQVAPTREISNVCDFLDVSADSLPAFPRAANAGVYPLSRLRFLGMRNRFLYDYDAVTGKLSEKRMSLGRLIPAATITLMDRWILSKIVGNEKPMLDDGVRMKLFDYYRDEIDGIAKITGRNLGSWEVTR